VLICGEKVFDDQRIDLEFGHDGEFRNCGNAIPMIANATCSKELIDFSPVIGSHPQRVPL
jgi:hypothetical protein